MDWLTVWSPRGESGCSLGVGAGSRGGRSSGPADGGDRGVGPQRRWLGWCDLPWQAPNRKRCSGAGPPRGSSRRGAGPGVAWEPQLTPTAAERV